MVIKQNFIKFQYKWLKNENSKTSIFINFSKVKIFYKKNGLLCAPGDRNRFRRGGLSIINQLLSLIKKQVQSSFCHQVIFCPLRVIDIREKFKLLILRRSSSAHSLLPPWSLWILFQLLNLMREMPR